MEASHHSDRSSPILAIFGITLVALAILAAIKGIESLDLPFSRHAVTSHEGQLRAKEIRDLIDRGKCSPVEAYYCPVPGSDHAKVICQLKGNIWGGLIIGLEGGERVIVTGYPASRSYWLRAIARGGCIPIAFGSVP
jgi:hypothetical protein